MKIKPFKDLIEPEGEKTQSFIYELLSYITCNRGIQNPVRHPRWNFWENI